MTIILKAKFPTLEGHGKYELELRAIQTNCPPSGVMPTVIKERSSWVWEGKPLYWIEDIGVEHEHEEIPLDEFTDFSDENTTS